MYKCNLLLWDSKKDARESKMKAASTNFVLTTLLLQNTEDDYNC